MILTDTLTSLRESGSIWNAEKSSVGLIKPKVIPFWDDAIRPQIPFGGFLTGAIHQASFDGEAPPLSFAARLGKQSVQANNKTILWIGETAWPTPHFLCDIDSSGSLFQKSLFITTPSEKKLLWAIQEAALSPAIGMIVVTIQKPTSLLLKQYSVKLRSTSGVLLLLQPLTQSAPKSAVCSSWQITSRNISLEYYRSAGTTLGQWKKSELLSNETTLTFFPDYYGAVQANTHRAWDAAAEPESVALR